MHVPFTCAQTSGVEIRGDCEHITKAICDEELSSSSPRARAVRPSWFVMGAHSPQQTIGAPRAVVVSQPKISDESSRSRTGMAGPGRAVRAEERTRVCLWCGCGLSPLDMGRAGQGIEGIHTTRRLSPCCVKMRAPCAHSTHVTYRWSWLAYLRAGQCCYIDRCFGRAGQPWVRRDTTTINVCCLLSISLASRDCVLHAVCVHGHGHGYQGRLVYAQHALRMLPSKQRRMASCAACGHPIRLYVITAASACVPIDARNRHTIISHNAQ